MKIHKLNKTEIQHPSRLYPVEPKGQGSGQLECLTGLTLRLADRHSMTTNSFYTYLLKSSNDLDTSKRASAQSYYSTNGYGKYANLISNSISKALEIPNMFFLTTLPWKNVFDPKGHGMLENSLNWCPQCWADDRKHGHIPYIRLAWLLKPYTICIHHNKHLITKCPNCQKRQPIVPQIPRPWICNSCGKNIENISNKTESAKTPKELWFSHAIDKLIERTCSKGVRLKPNCLTLSLNQIVDTHFDSSFQHFAKQIQFEKRYLKEWCSDIRKPAFSSFIELCYRMDIPPDALLLDEMPLTNPKNWRIDEKPKFINIIKLSKQQKLEIHLHLQKVIKDNYLPPIRPQHIAEKFNITYNVISYHFKDEYKIIRNRYLKWRQDEKIKKNKAEIDTLIQGIEILISKGLYPSERKLKEFKLVLPSVLRKKEVIKELNKYQNKFK